MDLGELLLAKRIINTQQKNAVDVKLRGLDEKSPGICSIVGAVADRGAARRCEEAEEARLKLLRAPEVTESLRSAYDRRAILFIGAGFSRGGSKSFSGDELRDHLVKNLCARKPHLGRGDLHVSSEDLRKLSLSDVAQVFLRMTSTLELTTCVENFCERELPTEVLNQHVVLARLNCFRFIFTTNWDTLIEDAIGKSECHVVREASDVTRIRYDGPNVIKLHGEYDARQKRFVKAPRVAAEQIASFAEDEPAIHRLLEALLIAHDVIVIGFRPNDYNFTHALRRASKVVPLTDKRVFVVDPDTGVHHLLAWTDVRRIRCDAIDYLDALESHIASEGGTSGRWRSDSIRLGAIAIHSEEPCAKARELGKLLKSVDRIELSCDKARGYGSPITAKQRVGRVAARLLADVINPGDSIAFSCGSTLESLAEEANSSWTNFARVRLYTASVPITHDCTSSGPISLAAVFAKRLAGLGVSCRSYQLPLDYIGDVADPSFRKYMPNVVFAGGTKQRSRAAITSYLCEASKAKHFVIGIGATAQGADSGLRRYLEGCLLSTSEYGSGGGHDRLGEYLGLLHDDPDLKYIGDVMYWLFKAIPRPIEAKVAFKQRFMNRKTLLEYLERRGVARSFKEFLARAYCQVRSLSPQTLAEAAKDSHRSVIAVAAGREKAEAVVAACNAGLINTLVVDEDLCQGMIDYLTHAQAMVKDVDRAVRSPATSRVPRSH
jgi:hypothetical protein